MLGHRIERLIAVVLPREERDPEDQEADDRGDRPMDPLDPGLRVVERRDHLVVAQGPVGATHPGVGDPHDDPDRDEQDRRDDRGDGGLLEAGHGRWRDLGSVGTGAPGAWRRGPILRATVRGWRRSIPRPRSTPATLPACPERPSVPPRSWPPSSRSSRSSPRARPPATPAPSAAAGPTVIPVIIGDQVKGPYRFVFSFLDAATNLPAAAPDRKVSVAFLAPGASGDVQANPATFMWTIDDEVGQYYLNTEFPQAGEWKAAFVTAKGDEPSETTQVSFEVHEDLPLINVGEAAPPSDTPTAADVGGDLTKLSTDTEPDPRFYEISVADALAAHRPFVLVFATPAFCKSRTCGPALDRVKAGSKDAPDDVALINVEPYQLAYTEGRLQPVLDANGQLQPVPSVSEWGLSSEPWVFTVGSDGIVKRSFNGMPSDQELKDAIAEIAAP